MVIDAYWGIKPNKAKALMLAQRELSALVHDAIALEGICFSLSEVQTLLEGVTVGGHRLADQQITLNQAAAWRQLFSWLKADIFKLNLTTACTLHAIAGKEDALEWGKLRSGAVTIAGTDYLPPPANKLLLFFDKMVTEAIQYNDIFDQAIYVFLTMARNQFFYDVNKRMGRFMMSGILLAAGYPVINLPAKRQLTFNQLMLAFYKSGNTEPMNRFMRSCLERRIIEIMQE